MCEEPQVARTQDDATNQHGNERHHTQLQQQSLQARAMPMETKGATDASANEHRLERRLSTPAQFKFGAHSTGYAHCKEPTTRTNTEVITAARAHIFIGEPEAHHLKGQSRRHRHAYVNRHHHHHRSVFRHSQDESSHKPASPASSTASDSAFSQSQTTLESESEQSNCFRRSLEGSSSSCHSRRTEREKAEGPAPGSLGADDNDDDESLGNNQFKIIWRQLSYRVPEKRFAQWLAYLERGREAFWPSSNTNNNNNNNNNCNSNNNEEIISEERVSSSSVASSEHHLHEGGPPLKAPTLGKPRKVIFSNLNGCVKSGQLTAILGPSGAGKTTFLKCLTNSIVKGVTGSIDITGDQQQATNRHLKLCIIPQKDYLFDNLTVMENLVFASRIKNPQPNFDHQQNVERVAGLLGLQACLKLKTSKLSGGQYKRVSITQELLSKPDILVLDEPTSGLDSLTCFRTVSVLRDLVNMSRAGLMDPLAIVMTIHQPQIKIFNLFHHVYILSSKGQCVYEGKPEHLIDTVADCCKLLPPPDDLNPASFIIDLASEVYGTEPTDRLTKLQFENFHLLHNSNSTDNIGKRANNLRQIELFVDGAKNHVKAESGQPDKQIHGDVPFDGKQLPMELDMDIGGEFRISDRLKRRHNHDGSFWLHTRLLIKRLWISMWRDSLLTTTRVTFHLIIPFVFYFIYSQKSGAANACPHVEREFDLQTMTSEENIHRLEVQHNELILTFENVSLFFLLLYSFSMCVLAVTALSFPLNMQILLKETSNGWYSMPRFVMAKTLADLPIELTMPMISVGIAYILTGQPSSYLCWRMLTVTAVMTLCSLISQTQGLLFGAYFMNNVQAAVFISQASSLPWIMLSGFTTRVSELPKILQWLSFGSIYRLGIESIVAVRYGFGVCPCDEELVNDTPAKMVGIPDQLRSVMRYYMDMYSEPSTTSNNNNSTGDIFEKIASTLSRANTYGLDIVSCHDVRPFILSAREVDEGTLPTFLLILVFIFVGLKVLLFCVVRLRAG